MEAKFTPGPWTTEGGWVRASREYGNGGEACIIGSIEYGPDAPDQETAYANAALLAAAPAMYEALQSLMNRAVIDAETYAPEGNEPIWSFISDAATAIAAAEGRS